MRKTYSILKLSILFIVFSTVLMANENIKNYKIGVLSLVEKEKTLNKWKKTAEHLSKKIPNSNFTIVPMTYDEINIAMKKAQIDYLLTNPAHYIIHENELQLFRLSTIKYSQKGYDISSFGGVIVTLKDNNDINTIHDLDGKKIAAVKKGSLGGYQSQIKEMIDNKVSPPDIKNVIFTDMPHRNTLDLLMDKKVDVAFLRSSVLERLSKAKEIDIDKFKIINRTNHKYPFFISTQLYPEWPFAALSHIDDETKKIVAETLFDIKSTDDAAVYGKYKGWYIPLDYNNVTELLRELRLPPFDKSVNFTFIDIVKKYSEIFRMLVLLAIMFIVYLIAINIKLHISKKELNKQTTKLKELNSNLNEIVERKVSQIREKDQKLLEQSKMASMGEMIGNIAHQWRQPLSAISTSATAIQMQKEMNCIDEKVMENMLDQINKHSQFLSQTIDTFQDFIKEDKKLSRVILQDRIDKALNIVSATVKNHHIKLINNIDYTNPIEIELVKGELSQVIMNIINNAKDIMIERDIKNPWIKIDLELKNQNVQISIEDNGGGMSDDILSHIFEPYFTTKHKSLGTGLGLHISYKIVTESFKGRVWAQNTQEGAKFIIELPLNGKNNEN